MLATLGAGVAFYGRGVSADDAAKIKAPLMLHFGGADTGTTGAWPAYEASLKANNKSYEAFIYEGAQHGFTKPGPAYQEKADKESWAAMQKFFKEVFAAGGK